MQEKLHYLNARETQIVKYLIQGQTNKQIAMNIHVSTHTVKYHLSNIYQKLGVNNRAMLIRAYYERRKE